MPKKEAAIFTEEQWLAAFKYLDRHPKGYCRWKNALAFLPGCWRNTLKTRYKARYTGPTVKGPPPRLGTDFESELIKWIEVQYTVGNCVDEDLLIFKARQFVVSLGLSDKSVGGPKWLAAFKTRHPQVSKRLAQICGVERLTAASTDNCERFLDIAEVASNGMTAENTHIVDEVGIAGRAHSRTVRAIYDHEFAFSCYFCATYFILCFFYAGLGSKGCKTRLRAALADTAAHHAARVRVRHGGNRP